ncbi:hypothetical protein [Parvularcula sp. IMCC14364]|nr:hypothetical protein [Parvularcula sp. IMCC14364]
MSDILLRRPASAKARSGKYWRAGKVNQRGTHPGGNALAGI